MIYEAPDTTSPLRQGDIFLKLPRAVISLQAIPVVQGDRYVQKTWAEAASSESQIEGLVSIGAVPAIVISQDCDAVRASDISLCEIRPFPDVHAKAKEARKVAAWVSIITQQARSNPKWFYLPPYQGLFDQRMGVDFFSTFRLPRQDLEVYRDLRRARLIDLAKQHFRERISEFFRRYPFDEWYSLSREEFAAYREKNPEAQPFPWQE